MDKARSSLLRRALLPVTGTAVAVGAFLGLPSVKALAQEMRILPRAIQPPTARLNIVQPPRVNPSARKLMSIADAALSDSSLAQRIFNDPEGVAAEYNLSDHEQLVLRHMNREQFEIARDDSVRVSQTRLAQAGGSPLPAAATDTQMIASGMVVGRALLAAVGRSYLEAANSHGCCPWGHAIELGVNPSRVFYDEVFRAPAANIRQPALEVLRPGERN